MASIGAGRLNQISNERAPWCSSMLSPFAERAPAALASIIKREVPEE